MERFMEGFAHGGALITPEPPLKGAAEMARLGSVGYVDLYQGLQEVPASRVTYGDMTKSYRTNMTGTNMQSCRPTLKYGDAVALGWGAKAAVKQRDGTVSFQAGYTTFLLRPPPGMDRQGSIRYGDSVVLTTSITARNTCGVYGCEVGNVVKNTLEVGPGGEKGGTLIKLEAPEGYSGEIVYGGPVLLKARVPAEGDVRRDRQKLKAGQGLYSPNGAYRFVYDDKGYGVYADGERVVWMNPFPHQAGYLMLVGNTFVVANKSNIPLFMVNLRGQPPFEIGVNDQGSFYLMGNGVVMEKTPPDNMPGQVDSLYGELYGEVVNDRLKFGLKQGSRFTLDSRPAKQCDVAAVTKLCGKDCPGILYSIQDGAWQPLTGKAGDYRETTTTQYVMMKSVSAQLDGLCPSGEAKVVSDFGVPKGAVGRCGPLETKTLPVAYAEEDQRAVRAASVLTEVVSEVKPKVRELKELSGLPEGETEAQRVKDWQVVNAQYKSRAVLWLVVAGVVGVMALALLRRKKISAFF